LIQIINVRYIYLSYIAEKSKNLSCINQKSNFVELSK